MSHEMANSRYDVDDLVRYLGLPFDGQGPRSYERVNNVSVS